MEDVRSARLWLVLATATERVTDPSVFGQCALAAARRMFPIPSKQSQTPKNANSATAAIAAPLVNRMGDRLPRMGFDYKGR